MGEQEITREEFNQLKEDVKTLYSRTNEASNWQSRYGEKIDHIEKDIAKLTVLIQNISSLPQKRWDSLVTGAIMAIITGVIGFMIAKIIGG